MELHSPMAAKKVWNYLRVAFFMMRKGLISKRKLVIDMNLMMKRGKLAGKNLGHLIAHHHRRRRPARGHGFALREYEFSCSNSPNPVFFRAGSKRRHHHHHTYFPCLNAVVEDAEDQTPPPRVVPRIEYTPSPSPSPLLVSGELAQGEAKSPIPVRVCSFSPSDEEEDGGRAGEEEVDDEAEQFIQRFYEQLRAQSRVGLIRYQDMEVLQMLARGR